jgi:hypothetical protein
MNKVLPISTGFSSLGMALGPVLMSYSRDVTGSYTVGFIGAAGLCVIGAILALGVTPLYWNRLRAMRGARSAA